ncbi:MAG: flagellar hook-basal body complex protein FliE [Pseudonocardiales bacterium]|jgi:flagellar hook-basal body complex protein FliE|nr:flagellar hook-basal body complex protein FliE [Pseudonocardiales bacterium]
MTIPAIGALTSALNTTPTSGITPTVSTGPTAPTASSPTSGSDFASMLSKGLDAVQSAQSNADNLAVQAATGDLTDVHAYTIAATQASLMTELATAIRTKGVDAFNQIMGMQA